MQTIGVIGAGLMGNGIAHVAAAAGYKVILSDVSSDRTEAAKATIAKNLARGLTKGTIDEATIAAILARISLTTDTAAFVAADLVIEAATENEGVKVKIFAELSPKLRPETLLATNTSSISITRLAAATDRPDRFTGLQPASHDDEIAVSAANGNRPHVHRHGAAVDDPDAGLAALLEHRRQRLQALLGTEVRTTGPQVVIEQVPEE